VTSSGIQHHIAQLSQLKMHYAEPGSGPPIVLLHGFPETWYCWRHQIPALSPRYRVIVPDLRGYGYTDKPASGYDKRTMPNDIWELMQHCGVPGTQSSVMIGVRECPRDSPTIGPPQRSVSS
jgi:pimeloyl-ACP methyl ester carboxylesterase